MLHTLLLLAAIVDPAAGVEEAPVAGDPSDVVVDVDLPPPALTPSMQARQAVVVQKSKVKDTPVVIDPPVDGKRAGIIGASACAGGAAVCAVPFGMPGVAVALALPALVGGGASALAGKDVGPSVGVGMAATLGTAGGAAAGAVVGGFIGGLGGLGFQVGSSRVDLQACKLEYSIVSPK